MRDDEMHRYPLICPFYTNIAATVKSSAKFRRLVALCDSENSRASWLIYPCNNRLLDCPTRNMFKRRVELCS